MTVTVASRQKRRQNVRSVAEKLDMHELGSWLLNNHANPIFIIDRDKTLLCTNRAADMVLDAKAGFSMHRGKLLLGSVKCDDQLKRIISGNGSAGQATPSRRRGITVARGDASQDWRVLIHGLQMESETSPPLFLLQAIGRIRPRHIPSQALRDMFGLTAGETTSIAALLRCGSIQEAADRLSRSRETVRTHVKCAFRKCGVHSKAELLALVHCISHFVAEDH